MHLVIDANVVIGLLVNPRGSLDIFFADDYGFVAPQIVWEEVEAHLPEVLRRSRLTTVDFDALMRSIRARVRTIPDGDFVQARQEAMRACPDVNDVQYFALALHLGCPLWSNDKALKKQHRVRVLSTHELLRTRSLGM